MAHSKAEAEAVVDDEWREGLESAAISAAKPFLPRTRPDSSGCHKLRQCPEPKRDALLGVAAFQMNHTVLASLGRQLSANFSSQSHCGSSAYARAAKQFSGATLVAKDGTDTYFSWSRRSWTLKRTQDSILSLRVVAFTYYIITESWIGLSSLVIDANNLLQTRMQFFRDFLPASKGL